MQYYWNLFRDKKQGRLFFLLGLTSAFDMLLLLFRNYKLGHLRLFLEDPGEAYILVNVTFIFLAWNLFLAWIPYLISLNLEWFDRRKSNKMVLGLVLLAWLLFFPNAPYLITDLIHLEHRAPIPEWFDLMLFFSFAWTGLILGFLSLQEVQFFLKKRLGQRKSTILVCLALLLCGFGVYLGRFQRWNSWDFFMHPTRLAADIFQSLTAPESLAKMVVVVLLFTVLTVSGHLLLASRRFHSYST